MPGWAGRTWTPVIVVELPLMLITTVAAPGCTSQGTWNVTCCVPFWFDTEEIGAGIEFTVMELIGPSAYGSGPNKLAEITPDTAVANPLPVALASPQATSPMAPLAVLVKLLAVIVGPGGIAVKAAVAENPPELAVSTIFPAVFPAVTVVEAWP